MLKSAMLWRPAFRLGRGVSFPCGAAERAGDGENLQYAQADAFHGENGAAVGGAPYPKCYKVTK